MTAIDVANEVRQELALLWQAHQRVGLTGKMCLYSIDGTTPWPPKTPGLKHWFGPDEIEGAVEFFVKHYNGGVFPYTALLLNPIVHAQVRDEYKPVGAVFSSPL